MDYKILVINPGSTSSKIAVYLNEEQIFVKSLQHSTEELAPYPMIKDQFGFRRDAILNTLKEAGIEADSFNAVIGRGGVIKPIPSGVYEVNELMREHMRDGYMGQHASNLGGLLADDIASRIPGCKAFIADPVVVDEWMPLARISGLPQFPRVCIFHALNQKAMARRHAASLGRHYEDMNLIVVHLGGGISVGAHQKGKVVDCNNALHGDGPFSPERTGNIALQPFAKMCFSGEYTYEQVCKMINGKGGMVAHMGTNSFRELSDRAAAGEEKASLIYKAMAYNVGKAIGAYSVTLGGEVDGIIFTGGMAHDKNFVDLITEHVKFIAPCFRYPGEDELGALSENALAALRGERAISEYR